MRSAEADVLATPRSIVTRHELMSFHPKDMVCRVLVLGILNDPYFRKGLNSSGIVVVDPIYSRARVWRIPAGRSSTSDKTTRRYGFYQAGDCCQILCGLRIYVSGKTVESPAIMKRWRCLCRTQARIDGDSILFRFVWKCERTDVAFSLFCSLEG